MSFEVEIQGDVSENVLKIITFVTKFCEEKLDEEYFHLCIKAIQYIIEDYEVLDRGKPENWASAIIYAIGSVNFLFDNSFEPYVSLTDITEYFGTKKSTITNKGREIKGALDMDLFDAEFSTMHVLENNPFNKMKMVDGFIVPIDEYQNQEENNQEPKEKSKPKPQEPKKKKKNDEDNMTIGLFE